MNVRVVRVRRSTTAPTHTSAAKPEQVSRPLNSVRHFRLGDGIPTVDEMRDELREYTGVLMGREEPPVPNSVLTLMEYANAVYSRGMELTMWLQRAETDGVVLKGSQRYKFRTGELRTFCEMASKAIELGSRRVTAAQLEADLSKG